MPMKNPPHPGRGLRQDCAEAGLSVTAAAKKLGAARVTFSRVLNGQAGYLARDGLKARSGRLVERRFLDASPSSLRPSASATTQRERSGIRPPLACLGNMGE